MNDKNQELTGPREDGEIDRPDVRTELDPLAMQAAVRMVFADASWLAKLVDGARMATGIPDWIEIV